MRFLSLGSGSRGNATLLQSARTLILVDCGFSPPELDRRCRDAGVDPTSIDALLLTHEHGDHSRGVAAAARRWGIPVWTSHGTARACELRANGDDTCRCFDSHGDGFEIGDIRVQPFAVPHDAREPCQFRFDAPTGSVGMLTDCGSVVPRVTQALDGVDALLLECNHDSAMLAGGPYPPSLRRRVGGRYGHLNNDQSAELLSRIDHRRLRHLAIAHISEKNNRPELARDALLAVAPEIGDRLSILAQDRVSAWFVL